MRDDRTPNRNYPLPHPDNYLEEDVDRLRNAISGIDEDVGRFDDHCVDPSGHPVATPVEAGFMSSQDKAKLDVALVEDDVIALILALG